jgi:hypothetical protein
VSETLATGTGTWHITEEHDMDNWLDVQKAAIAAQKAAHAALANGGDIVPAAESGPLALYTRAQTLDYLAQLLVVLEDDAHLPNATGPGLTILPGTPRNPLDPDDRTKFYEPLVETLKVDGKYTEDEVAEAVTRLRANLDASVTLDPATAENV